MSTSVLLGFAVVVFTLMLTGLALTAREFLRVSDDPSLKKGVNVREGRPTENVDLAA